MYNNFFNAIENSPSGHTLVLAEVIAKLAFNEQGLIPIITQDANSKKVLMLAWMNKTALERTLACGYVTYWSRSRQALWKKGQTSGHLQALQSMHIDCDGDAILCLVEQIGGTCHTGRDTCFYLKVNNTDQSVTVTSSVP